MVKNKAMSRRFEILEGAIFIADSHTNSKDKLLIETLKNMEKSPPPQLFLLGDIAKILVGNIKSSVSENRELLETIESISKKCEVFYFEGNHDFGLSSLKKSYLKNVEIFSREAQPALFKNGKNEKILIAHGDLFLSLDFRIYIYILTSRIAIRFLGLLDFLSFGKLYGFISKTINKKNIRGFRHPFEKFAKERIGNYLKYCTERGFEIPKVVVEGHFHADKKMESMGVEYISIESFKIKRVPHRFGQSPK